MSQGFQEAADTAAPVVEPTATFNQAAGTAQPTQPQVQVMADGSLAVDGRIFTPQAAATKIAHADQHIQTLETENAEKDAATLALLERIEALEKSRRTTDALDDLITAQPVAPVVVAPEPSPQQEISKEEIVQEAVNAIKGDQAAAQQDANLSLCIAEAQGVYGDAYHLKIDELSVKHGMNADEAVEMAKNRPLAFKALFIEGAKVASPDSTRSSVGGLVGQGGIAPPAKFKSIMKMSAKDRLAHINAKMAALSPTSGT